MKAMGIFLHIVILLSLIHICSGKSTILNLIAKYYEANGGTISIGGKPINHVAAERVLEQISMVDQDVFLFDDTIRENIRHARPNATDEEIEAACREANCDSFIPVSYTHLLSKKSSAVGGTLTPLM